MNFTTNMLIAFVVSLVITILVMPSLIRYLHKIKFGQVEREEGLESHKKKGGTPTMGGIVFVVVPIIVSLIVYPKIFTDFKMLIVMLAYFGYATIGFIDDFIIVVKKNNEGLKPKVKFLMQSVLAIAFYLMYQSVAETTLWIPLLDVEIELGIFYFFLIMIMFTAESNAVNLTDGLDGLSSGCMIVALAPFILFAIVQNEIGLAVFLLAVLGSLLGFLKNNFFPAKIFMGDTGSLALGGLLAACAMVLKKEILLIIIGGIFVMETLSVVLQVGSFKLTGKRIFRMAPLHHHFELGGMNEKSVVFMFWTIELVFALVGYFLGVM